MMKEGYCPYCEENSAQRFYGNYQVVKMLPGKEYHQVDETRSPFFTCLDEIWWCPNCGNAYFYGGMLLEKSAKLFFSDSEENMKRWKEELKTYKAPGEEYFG